MQEASPQKLEGWLLKKGAKSFGGNAFKKRWFSLQQSRLYYYQNKGDTNNKGYIDVMAATAIIPSGAKRNCEFQIVTPTRVFTLQAATESAMNEWVNALNTYRRHVIRKSRGEEGDTRRASLSDYGIAPVPEAALNASTGNSTIGGSRTERRREPAQRLFGSRGGSTYLPSSAGIGDATAPPSSGGEQPGSENHRLQLLLNQKEEQLLAKEGELKKLKDTVVSELRSLTVKQGLTEEELSKLKDELSLAQKMITELRKKEEEGGSGVGGVSGGGGGGGEEVQRLRKELEEKDKQIEEQRIRIEALKTKLEQRIEEEANMMKERVKETMGRLRKEHEEQLKKVREGGSNSLEEEVQQLRKKNQELEEQLKRRK